MVPITRKELERLIPHAGAMCLLDGILEWNEDEIFCVSETHRNRENPLRRKGILHAICGIEYAAQAMAAHGVLAGGAAARPSQGYLASIRDFHSTVSRLDAIAGDIIVKAQKSMCLDQRVLYEFSLTADGQRLMHGRAAAVLQVIAP